MKIKFKAPDPRAGMTVQMDSRLGQQFIDSGAADPVNEGGAGVVRAVAEPVAQPVVQDDGHTAGPVDQGGKKSAVKAGRRKA